jgi:hypothetical protein
MIRNKKILKSIAYFFLLSLLSEILAPATAYALSSSPYTPESETFMGSGNMGEGVNEVTGDFSYNVPLLDVPGPEGSYPINAFYRAGIKPEQDASWIGLGWNVNVGSINRNIVGFPDDYSAVPYKVTDTWTGVSANSSYSMSTPLSTNRVSTSLGQMLSPVTKYYTIPLDPTTANIYAYGALKGYDATTGSNVTATRTFDCLSQSDPDSVLGDQSNNTDPDKLLGGSYPAYDIYSVSAQGMSGAIEPVVLDNGSLFRNRYIIGTDTIRDFKIEKNFTVSKPQFRFKKDFSNSFITTPTGFSVTSTSATYSLGSNGMGYTYTGPDTTIGYNTTLKKLAGSKNIEYYTNGEIVSGTAQSAGFIKYQGLADGSRNNISLSIESGGTKNYNVTSQIGGFSVTTADGTTYHYALPAYTYSYTKKLTAPSSKTSGRTARVVSFSQAYAYTWLLTSITSSNFVDRNSNGYADEGDTGGWTNFTYGKKTDNYISREPYTGTYNDIDGSNAYNACRKQVYYLDAAYSRSHTAFFSKSASRLDAQGANDTITGGRGTNSATTMQLDSVILYENNGLKSLLSSSSIYAMVGQVQQLSANSYIDNADFTSLNSTYSTAKDYKISSVVFAYDYSLCPRTPNSTASTLGKLSLTSIAFKGRYGYQAMPAMTFNYELSAPISGTLDISNMSGRRGQVCMPGGYAGQYGDILKITSGGNTYYATVIQVNGSCSFPNPPYGGPKFDVIFLGDTYPSGNVSSCTFSTTKNPPYTANFYDSWGNFKSDYKFSSSGSSQNSWRKSAPISSTSPASFIAAVSVDVWSLRKIQSITKTITEVAYESDTYYNVEQGTANAFNMGEVIGFKKRSDNSIHYSDEYTSNAFPIGEATGDWYKVYFKDLDSAGFTDYFTVNDTVTLASISSYLDSARTTPFTDTAQYGTGKFKILVKGNDSKGYYLTIGYTGTSGNTTTVESQNPLRYPYAGTTNTVLNIFPGTARSTSSHLHKHLGSFIIPDKQYASQKNAYHKYGGGIRVKSIKTTESSSGGDYFETQYGYNDVGAYSSGSTSYEPSGYDGLLFTPLSSALGSIIPNNFYTQYNSYLAKYMSDLFFTMGLSREIPGPGVLYNFVTIKNYGNGKSSGSYKTYNYQVYSKSMIERVYLAAATAGANQTRKLRIKDYTSRTGNLMGVASYDKTGRLVYQTNYKYDNGTNIPGNQGVLEQVFHEHRILNKGSVSESHRAMVTVKSTYPSVMLSSYSSDALKNISDSIVYKSFDFYTGALSEKVSDDIYGNFFKSRSVSAYSKYPGMGPKVVTASNKHILSANAASYVFKVSPSNYNTHIDTMSCSIQTWDSTWNKRSLNGGIYYTDITDGSLVFWRPEESWAWNSPQLNTDGSWKNFVDFNFTGGQATGWQKQGNISKYDVYSHGLESKDLNNNYSSAKVGYDQSMVIAKGAGSRYAEVAYSGAEDLNTSGDVTYFGGEVYKGSGTQSTTYAHTGKYSLSIAQNNSGLIYRAIIDTTNIERGKNYRASVWLYDNGNTNAGLYYKLTNTSGTQLGGTSTTRVTLTGNTNVLTCGKWKLLTMDILIPGSIAQGNLLEIGCDNQSATIAYVDDMRFYPVDFPISTYVYDPVTKQQTYVLDHDNLYTRMAYDNAGRLVGAYKETTLGEKLLKTKQYNIPQ